MSTPHALYRFYSPTGQLLYVGITNNPGARFQQHQKDKPWWHEVAGISVERYDSRDAVLAAERRAIEVEHPLYNIQHPTISKRSGRVTAHAQQLVWICEGCRLPVDDGAGYIHLESAELREAEKTRPSDDGDWKPVDLNAWLDWEPAQWRVHHAACDPAPDAGAYHFVVERARTHAQLLSWTAHLMGKAWLEATDWQELIERMAGVQA